MRAVGRSRARRATPSGPESGSITITPRSMSVSTFACVAASAYILSFIAGATARGAVVAQKDVVSIESQIPAASFAIVFADAGATIIASAFWARARWPIGSWLSGSSPGIAAAHRVVLELLDEHRRADDALERRGADEALRVAGHDHAHAVAGRCREPGELKRFVGGDAAADTEQDPRHARILRLG